MARQTLGAGPWKGVRDTLDPYDDPADPGWLQDAQNCYIPDPQGMSGIYARTGFYQGTAGAATTVGISGCTQYTMTALDGTVYRFAAAGGKVYRITLTGTITTVTDVTPVGVTIDATTPMLARYYMGSFANQLWFTDGVNRPWLGTNLASTPITATAIDLDGAGGSWSAQGRPAEYKGSLFFIAKTVPAGSSVNAGVGIVWCEPNQPATGYVQSGYADFWNLIQTSSLPLYAIHGTNVALYYWREASIGALAGTPGGNFSTTASEDAVSFNVGCTSPASVLGFGNNIFFCDVIGRPWMFEIGGPPQPIWQSLRGQIDANPSYLTNRAAIPLVGQSALVPALNVVLIGAWGATGVSLPTTMYAFDGLTGTYFGRWSSGYFSAWDAMAPMKDENNVTALWVMSKTGSSTEFFYFLTQLANANWLDNGQLYQVLAKTQRLGYSAGTVWNADLGAIVTTALGGVSIPALPASCTITVTTPYQSSVTETSIASAIPGGTGILVASSFLRGTTVTITVNACKILVAGVYVSVAAAANASIGAILTITANKWGIFAIDADGSGNVTFTVTGPGATQAFATEALAITNAPPLTSGKARLGTVTILTAAGQPWIAGTDSLAGGATGNVATTTNYNAVAATTSQDSTYRIPFGMDVQAARGIQITVSPNTGVAGWSLQRVECEAVPSKAGIEDN